MVQNTFQDILISFKKYVDDFFIEKDIILYDSQVSGVRRKKILLSLSGGPDSFLCFLLLLELKKIDPQLEIAIINFNHKTNPNDFFKEEKYIDSLGKSMNFKVYRYYLQKEREENNIPFKKLSQNYFRDFRMQNIIKTAYENDYELCITGHNLEDLVDTFLMRLGKGSGIWGLRSPIMQSKEIHGLRFFRPLIHTSRGAIEKIMKNRPYFLDPTRKNPYQRNLVRSLHGSMAMAGIMVEGIYLSILRQEQYHKIREQNMRFPMEKGYNYVLISGFIALSSLEKRENIMGAMNHIIPGSHIEFTAMENLIKEIMEKITINRANSLFSYNAKEDRLLVTKAKSPEKFLLEKNNDISIEIHNNLLKINRMVFWSKQRFFLLKPGNYKTHIIPFYLLVRLLNSWGHPVIYKHALSLPKIVVDSMASVIIDYGEYKKIILHKSIFLQQGKENPLTIEFMDFAHNMILISP